MWKTWREWYSAKIRLIKHRDFGIIEPFDKRVDELAKGKPTEKVLR